MTSAPSISTLGELRASGHVHKTLRTELRDNLLTALREDRDPWPGLHGFDDTVIPQLERAIIAGHDVVLLGERGQGKTRLIRGLIGLLDEWTPMIEGTELREHPYHPVTPAARRLAVIGFDAPEGVSAASRERKAGSGRCPRRRSRGVPAFGEGPAGG